MAQRAALLWSGGKDSMLALHILLSTGEYEVTGLITTVTEQYERISIHGVRESLLREQVAAIGLDLQEVLIPKQCSNEDYERIMLCALAEAREAGVELVAAGDIFLEDVRRYRENLVSRADMECIFPLWGESTTKVAQRFVDLGFRAITVCIDSHALDSSFVGQDFDSKFLARLPEGADCCGENGEFHTFVYDGPGFRKPVTFGRGEIVLKDERFYYCDLVETTH